MRSCSRGRKDEHDQVASVERSLRRGRDGVGADRACRDRTGLAGAPDHHGGAVPGRRRERRHLAPSGARAFGALGQQVIVENIGGAGGMAGSAASPGRLPTVTFVLGNTGTHA